MAKTGRRKDYPGYISKASLKYREGWTESTINHFFPEPDLKVPHPYYRSGPDMSLYSLRRIEEIETTPEFTQWKDLSEKRRSYAKKATETKKQRLKKYIDELVIEVVIYEKEKLQQKAINSYNNHKLSLAIEFENRGREFDFTEATENSSEQFLNRLMVNYLRHHLTKYEYEINNLFGKVGNEEVYLVLFEKVLKAIANTYPFLSDECERQIEAKLQRKQLTNV